MPLAKSKSPDELKNEINSNLKKIMSQNPKEY